MLTPEQAAAFVNAQSVAALADIEGMKIVNADYAAFGHPPCYHQSDFEAITDKYGLGYNTIMQLFNDANEAANV